MYILYSYPNHALMKLNEKTGNWPVIFYQIWILISSCHFDSNLSNWLQNKNQMKGHLLFMAWDQNYREVGKLIGSQLLACGQTMLCPSSIIILHYFFTNTLLAEAKNFTLIINRSNDDDEERKIMFLCFRSRPKYFLCV